MRIQKLINAVQNCVWGSYTALIRLHGIANPGNLPIAELWMGAHPKSSSRILAADGQSRSLREVIDADKTALLGNKVAARFGKLPFLFKVLRAAQPFSIQVHPNKQASEEDSARESAAGIPLSAAERDYRDPNHKPELVFALAPFPATSAFHEFSEVVALLQPVASACPAIGAFLQRPDATHLNQLFTSLPDVQGEEKAKALQVLRDVLAREQGEPWQTIRPIAEFYPDDSGFFSSLLLNMVKLSPGEAMSLSAETPHAYLQGVALEVMVSSNNVPHAGLMPKYIDIPELVASVEFETKPAGELLTQPQQHGAELDFPIPVEDFAFSLHDLSAETSNLAQASAAIIFCVDGEAVLCKGDQSLTLKPGESAFVAASESPVQVSERSRVARMFNKLQ